MGKPWQHAESSARKFGGKPEDYVKIHELMDLSKTAIADNRHRMYFHNSWAITHILPLIFGETFKNSDGRTVSTRDVGEQHCLEDFGHRFIPTLQDYLENCESKTWMDGNVEYPSSAKKIESKRKELLNVQKTD